MDVHADIRDLIDRARRGVPEAIGQLLEAARGQLLELADQELPEDLRAKIGPSDVVQETAVEAHRDFADFTGTTAEECFAWLRMILRHNVVDAVRRYRESLKRNVALEVRLSSGPMSGVGTLVEPHRPPDGSAIRREEAGLLNDTLARLPADYRQVLELRYWSGLSFVEMAPQLGRSPEAARKLWYRAVERLQAELAAGAAKPSEVAAKVPGHD
jgi:RNA polymerase sigma-70 factor (ECF subfamily)